MEETRHECKKKPRLQPHKYKEISSKIVQGSSHERHQKPEEIVPAAQIGPNCRCKRLQCFSNFDDDMKQHTFQSFYKLPSKNAQDAYLAGLISVHTIQQRRPRAVTEKSSENTIENTNDAPDTDEEIIIGFGISPHEAAYTYKIRILTEEIQVCLIAFLSLHGIGRSRIRRIQHALVKEGSPPLDRRGQVGLHYRLTPQPVNLLMEGFIKTLRVKQSHYTLRHTPNKYYVHEDLHAVSQVHKEFLEKYQINVSYKVFLNTFNQFNISFAQPRSDTCNTCDSLQSRITSATSSSIVDTLKAERKAHQTLVEQYTVLKHTHKQRAKSKRGYCFSFDFMQNLPLPNVGTNVVFYKRQLWYHVFGIHDYTTDDAHMYTYTEIDGKRGSNDVISMLFDFFRTSSIVGTTKPLTLICDSCPGQNKNFGMIMFLYILVHFFKWFPSITVLYPVRGHSFLPNDSDFSVIGRSKKSLHAETPNDWTRHIQYSRTSPRPFVVHEFKREQFLDFFSAFKKYFTNRARLIQLKKVRVVKIVSTSSDIKVKHNYTEPWKNVDIRNRKNKIFPTEFAFNSLYLNPLPLKVKKKKDLLDLVQYLQNPDSASFYDRFRDPLEVAEEWNIDEEELFEIDIEIDYDSDNNSGIDEDYDEYEDYYDYSHLEISYFFSVPSVLPV